MSERTTTAFLERMRAEGHHMLPVLVSVEVLQRLAEGLSPPRRLTLSEIGEPDRDGFFTPTFTIDIEDRPTPPSKSPVRE